MKISGVYLVAGVAVAAAVAYVAIRGAKNFGADLGGYAVDMVDGVITGTVEGIGEKVGIPKTNQTACERAKAEGRTWDASFDCPAADFLKYVWN